MPRKTRVSFVSLGCAKNLVDSEKMLGQLAEAGCAITADEANADVTVINTCGFLDAARIEADEVIRQAVERKAAGKLKRVVVAGCLVQRDKEAILDRVPGIDALVGVNNRDDIVRAVLGDDGRVGPAHQLSPVRKSKRSSSGARSSRQSKIDNRKSPDVYLADYHPFVQIDTARLRLTPRHYAYLRISEGCDQKCTFCTIPSIRGPMHCKPPQLILEEARELIADGVREISLIGQDTTSYGLGADPLDANLAGLLRMLNGLEDAGWIRLMYVYPSVFTDEMIDAIAECEHVCKYIDIPLQHINDRVLKAMHRRISRKATEALLQKIRDRIPGVTIRTTMIAGFPGETQAEFDDLVRFVHDFEFDALGVFPYSREDSTPAGRMAGQLSEQIKQERVEALMLTQQKVAFRLAQRRIGSTMDVLIDSVSPEGVVARHQGQAPMVDSTTRIEGYRGGMGEFIAVRCTARDGYDLVARAPRGRAGSARRAADNRQSIPIKSIGNNQQSSRSLPVLRT